MAYAYPPGSAADFRFPGTQYTAPNGTAADFSPGPGVEQPEPITGTGDVRLTVQINGAGWLQVSGTGTVPTTTLVRGVGATAVTGVGDSGVFAAVSGFGRHRPPPMSIGLAVVSALADGEGSYLPPNTGDANGLVGARFGQPRRTTLTYAASVGQALFGQGVALYTVSSASFSVSPRPFVRSAKGFVAALFGRPTMSGAVEATATGTALAFGRPTLRVGCAAVGYAATSFGTPENVLTAHTKPLPALSWGRAITGTAHTVRRMPSARVGTPVASAQLVAATPSSGQGAVFGIPVVALASRALPTSRPIRVGRPSRWLS